jgi:hypothetical protein
MLKINMKNFNIYTVISVLLLIIGLVLWIGWMIRYGIVYNIGIYALAIFFIIPGIVGFILSLMDKEEN